MQTPRFFVSNTLRHRAYKAADTGANAGLIGRKEFKLLLRYVLYLQRNWPQFEKLDSSPGRVLDAAAFAQDCALLHTAAHGKLGAKEVESAFAAVQRDGQVAFDDFCSWAVRLGAGGGAATTAVAENALDTSGGSPRSGSPRALAAEGAESRPGPKAKRVDFLATREANELLKLQEQEQERMDREHAQRVMKGAQELQKRAQLDSRARPAPRPFFASRSVRCSQTPQAKPGSP